MAWYKALRNARVGKARYLKGAVVELDAKLLEGKADNFEACAAPGAAKEAAKPKEHKEPAKPKTFEHKVEPKTEKHEAPFTKKG